MPAPLRPETIARRVGLAPAVPSATLVADLAREKAERALDADRLGEMLARVAAVEAERRTLAIQLIAANERALAFEAELERVHQDVADHRGRAFAAIRAREEEAARANDTSATALADAVAAREMAEQERDRARDEARARSRELAELRARVVRAENETSRMALALEAAESAAEDERARGIALEERLALGAPARPPSVTTARTVRPEESGIDSAELARVRREGLLALEAIRTALSSTERALGQVLGLAPSSSLPGMTAVTPQAGSATRPPTRSSRPAGAARTKSSANAP